MTTRGHNLIWADLFIRNIKLRYWFGEKGIKRSDKVRFCLSGIWHYCLILWKLFLDFVYIKSCSPCLQSYSISHIILTKERCLLTDFASIWRQDYFFLNLKIHKTEIGQLNVRKPCTSASVIVSCSGCALERIWSCVKGVTSVFFFFLFHYIRLDKNRNLLDMSYKISLKKYHRSRWPPSSLKWFPCTLIHWSQHLLLCWSAPWKSNSMRLWSTIHNFNGCSQLLLFWHHFSFIFNFLNRNRKTLQGKSGE